MDHMAERCKLNNYKKLSLYFISTYLKYTHYCHYIDAWTRPSLMTWKTGNMEVRTIIIFLNDKFLLFFLVQ